MNTGIGDAFNLAHKLAKVIHEGDQMPTRKVETLMRTYNTERRYVGNLTKDYALINYEKSLFAAKELKLDKSHADNFTWALNNVGKFIPFFDPKAALKVGLDIGLNLA
jgi:2-polyprenyl-6-methoxyphenol hydroxylase-like FAD-dependent oxidoreductase